MKDIMSKLADLEATAPKITKKKMLNEDSTTPPMNVSDKPASLKDVFESLAGQKPVPVVGREGDTQQTGAGFVNIVGTDPASQALGKAVGDLAAQKKLQIVVPTQGQQSGQPAPAGATGQQPVGQQQMKEKWAGDVKLNPEKKGMFKGKTKAELEKQLAALHKSGPHKKGSPEYTKQQELNFAIRAKSGWKEDSVEEGAGAKDWHDDMEQWALNKGRKNTGSKSSLERAADRDKDWALSHRKSDTVKEGAKVDRMVKHIEKSERKLGKSKEKASDIAWATANKRGMLDNKNKKVKEGDIPSTQGIDTKGAGLGAGRSATTLEGKKPDFLDLDKDGNKKESMKKAAADKKKKKVDESMNHRISAARLEGKSHGLRGHAYHGKAYEDLEEMKAYHEGYKEGLDECYGQGVYETAPAMPAATVGGMADDAMGEGNAFTAALARTPKGGKFSVGGKTFTDRSSHDAKIDEYAFESLDKQLNDLLNEGLSVSVSKGQQNSPDSVTITAQDAEADQLLQLVKSAGLGLFGGDEGHEAHPSSAMSIQPAQGAADEVGAGGVDIDVVDDSDSMLSLMKKLGGVEQSGAEDYADEEGDEDCGCNEEETNEVTCNECGMMEGMHESGCSKNKEMVDEVESEDQMEFEVSEDNAPDSGEAESTADEDAEAKEDAALAGEKEEEMNESFFDLLGKLTKLSESAEEDEEGEEEVTESDEEGEEDAIEESEELNEWANQVGKGPGKGTDASFEQDIEFMTKVIAGGLNKPKSTGQTTIPVIAGQEDRMHDSPKDWATLAGIKK